MSAKKVKALAEQQYDFIIGARIKKEPVEMQQKILSLKIDNEQSAEIQREITQRLIISYTEWSARKDNYNRTNGMEGLKKQLEKGKLTKEHISNKGYNKYLKLAGEIKVVIDEEKFKDDAKWDGLKGYLTNTKPDKETVLSYYRQLWQIEKTFRITKTDLRIRPIYQYKKRRIESHICIAFAACKVYKELEVNCK